MDFEQEFLSVPMPPNQLTTLAKEYIDSCEAFDRRVCTARDKHGIAMPATSREAGLINQHAMEVRKRLMVEVEAMRFTATDFSREINRVRGERIA